MISLLSLILENDNELVVYHSYYGNFNLNNYNFDRGIFAITPWWVGKPEYKQYSAFRPNEFGDKVVALRINKNTKIIEAGDQFDLVEQHFPDGPAKTKFMDLADSIHEKEDWQKLDEAIGRFVKKKGVKLIHYTDDQMYGDVYVILDKSIILDFWFDPSQAKV